MKKNDLSIDVSGFNENNPHQFWQVFNRYHRSLYLLAFNILRDKAESEDIVSDVFEMVWEKEDKHFENESNIAGFLHITTRNRCFTHLRKKMREEKNTEAFGWLMEPTVPGADMELIKANVKQALYAEIERLPPGRREVIKLKYLEEMSEEEVAAKLGVSRHTVRNQEKKALKKMKNNLPSDHRKLLSILILISKALNN